MKKIFLAIFALSLFHISRTYGQDNVNVVQFFESIFKNDTNKILYLDSVRSLNSFPSANRQENFKQDFSVYLSKDKIRDFLKPDSNYIILTKEEKHYILNEMEKSQQTVWPPNLFKNSTRILSKRLKHYLKKSQVVCGFSKPIFLRDNSVCLIYSSYRYGVGCFQDEICFYKKNINGKWERWISVSFFAT